jgi:hypothetical protein
MNRNTFPLTLLFIAALAIGPSAAGTRQSAYQGRYEITGTHIEYWDDTGFTADGDFVDENTLHHGGMIFRRR